MNQQRMQPVLRLFEGLGRLGTGAVAFTLLLGTVMPPPVGRALKPYLTEAVFLLLCIAFLRMDTSALKGYLNRPVLVIAALCWTSIAIPLALGAGGLALGLPEKDSSLFLGILLQAVASPIMSAPAMAALMGMESTLVLVTLVISTAMVPLTAPLFAHMFADSALVIAPMALAGKLSAILAGAACTGLILRRRLGISAVQRFSLHLDGLNIIILFIFAAAIMENVGMQLISAPRTLLAVGLISLSVFLLILFTTFMIFLPSGRERALTLGFMTSNRNMGLMLAATGGLLPEVTWIYLAMSQLPIYLSPHLLKLAARRIRHTTGS